VLIAFFATLRTWWPAARYANAVLGSWLVVSSFFLPRLVRGTAWYHILVGIVVLWFSLLPHVTARRRRPTGTVPAR
jgi:hypothetical protein